MRKPGFDRLSLSGVSGAGIYDPPAVRGEEGPKSQIEGPSRTTALVLRRFPLRLSLSKAPVDLDLPVPKGFAQRTQRTQRDCAPARGRAGRVSQPGFDRLSLSGVCGAGV